MSSIEYVQNMPAAHRFHQQKVNKQLWRQWNLVDHQRAMADHTSPFVFEQTLFSPGAEHRNLGDAVDEPPQPPALTLHYTICSRRWRQEEECRIAAQIGEIVFAKDGTGNWDTSGIRISYAMQRVDTPYRWEKYCIHHLPSESFEEVINQHTQ
jgi:hypothetical protein